MPILRNQKEDNFTVIDNETLHDKSLSWKAKGLLSYLLSLPPDWDLHLSELENHATDGESSTRTGIDELKERGYIHYKKEKDAKGHFQHIYHVYERPKKDPLPENPDVENPDVDNPDVDNQELQRTNEQSTDLESTNNKLVDESTLPTLSNLPRKDNNRRDYPDRFEEVWSFYPRRNYPSKGAAYKKYRARIEDGAAHQELLEAARNYQKLCEQEDKIGSQYVMKAKTFFGPSEHWVEFVGGDFEIEEEKDTAFKTEFNGDADEYEY